MKPSGPASWWKSLCPRDSGGRGTAVAAMAVAALAIALFPLLWSPWIHGNDGVRNYAYCRSFWMDRDLDFANEFAHYREAGEIQFSTEPDPATGRPGNPLGIGSAVLWSPFFLAGHLAALASSAPADGYSAPYVSAVCLGSTLYALVGLVLLVQTAARRFSAGAAALGVGFAWLGSPLIFYMYLHPSMSHACSFFLCALLLWECERWLDEPGGGHFFAIGLTLGLAVATRFANGVFVLLPVALWVDAWRGTDAKKRFTSAGLLALGGFVGMLPQLAAWRGVYGSWFSGPRGYGLESNLAVWSSPHALDVLFSPRHGLFLWSPVLLLGFAGFCLALRRWRTGDRALAAAFLVQLWVIGGWVMWWGGASFGMRFFINFVPVFALGLAYLFHSATTRAARAALATAAALCLLWTGGLAVQYMSGMVDREAPLQLGELVQNQKRTPAWVGQHLRLLLPGQRAAALEQPLESDLQ